MHVIKLFTSENYYLFIVKLIEFSKERTQLTVLYCFIITIFFRSTFKSSRQFCVTFEFDNVKIFYKYLKSKYSNIFKNKSICKMNKLIKYLKCFTSNIPNILLK